jgi:hypothetical protein
MNKLNVSSSASLITRLPHNHVLRAHDEVVLVLHYNQDKGSTRIVQFRCFLKVPFKHTQNPAQTEKAVLPTKIIFVYIVKMPPVEKLTKPQVTKKQSTLYSTFYR